MEVSPFELVAPRDEQPLLRSAQKAFGQVTNGVDARLVHLTLHVLGRSPFSDDNSKVVAIRKKAA